MPTVNADNTDSQLNEAILSLNLRSSKQRKKKEQDLAIKSLLKEKDALAVLPTGFGKSLVFQVFAVVKSLDLASLNGCVLIICPLKSIIVEKEAELQSYKDHCRLSSLSLARPLAFDRTPFKSKSRNNPYGGPVCRL